MVDAAAVGHQHQVVLRRLVRQGGLGEVLVTLLHPFFAADGFTEDEVRGLAGPDLRAAEHFGAIQAQVLQTMANVRGGLAAGHGDPGRVAKTSVA